MPLFEMNAEAYVQNHQTCMYPLLPDMNGFHANMTMQVMSELSEKYRDDHGTLAEQFIWMQLCLDRTDTIELSEKINIRGRLSMFDQLWEESPTIQKMRVQYEVQGFEKGEVQTLQRTLVEFVQIRFPELTELAQRQAQLCKKPEVLETMTRELFKTSETGMAQQLLVSMSEQ